LGLYIHSPTKFASSFVRNSLGFRCYGLWPRSASHSSFQRNVIPGFTFPAVGRLGITSPPSRSTLNHRYYDPLRLPNVHLGLVHSSLSAPDTLPTPLFSLAGRDRATLSSAGAFTCSLVGALRRFIDKGTFGSPKFPSYPFEHMPWSKTPVVTPALAISCRGLLPSATCIASAFPVNRIIPKDHNYTFFGVQYRAYTLDPVRLRTSITGFALGLHY